MLDFRDGSVVIRTAHTPYNLRNDGKLRSDARNPEHPGVVLLFEVWDSQNKRYEKMSFECDKFTDWKANVRAIADALEALRKVNRYAVSGGGKLNAHYQGYKPLPETKTTLNEAAEFISEHSNYTSLGILKYWETFIKAHRDAVKKLHPDNQKTGSHELFIQLQYSKDILDKHYKDLE